jgi:hypothetical protein
MRRALIVIGWIATLPGFIGLLGLAVLLTDAEWLFGCRKSGILGITCPQDPLGWFAELLWFGGLALFVWFPATAIPVVFALGYPIVRLVMRRRQAADATAPGGSLPEETS